MGRASQRRLVQYAYRQFGLVTAADVAGCRVSRGWMQRRMETGEWSRIYRGVFRLGANASLDAREMAGLLAVGDGAVLSHISAARRLGLDVPVDDSVQITVPTSRHVRKKLSGVRIWHSRDLLAKDITTRGPFRITHLGRTIVDLASVLDDACLRVAVDSALRQQTTHFDWIWRSLWIHGNGRCGAKRLRKLLDKNRRGDERPDSALESLAMQLAEKVGVRPKLHLEIVENGQLIAETDLSWPEVRLCVQLDGWRYHSSREAFVRDRARDRALVRLGWTVLRYTSQDVDGDPETMMAELSSIYQSRALALSSSRPKRAPLRLR